ncbi:element excision factor XisH family protein [Calothrix sp. CCY 0018]|uniref:element excision factor XisH family protein n=1 Tax=Calothrix sp. CCY 0018 TaxID=3103864 RepID=UPI0039C6415D
MVVSKMRLQDAGIIFSCDWAIAQIALGQFLNYRLVLKEKEKERILYLAVPIYAY